MLVQFHTITCFSNPVLYVWRPGTNLQQHRPPTSGPDTHGVWTFDCELDHQIHEHVQFKLYNRPPESVEGTTTWEHDEHNRLLPRLEQERFPEHVWIVEGAQRVITDDPFADACQQIQIHLVTANKFRQGRLFIWTPGQAPENANGIEGTEETDGMHYQYEPQGDRCHLFLFKFMQADGSLEGDIANRVWCSADGAQVWTHSDAAGISVSQPTRRKLRVHFRQEQTDVPAMLHFWQSNSDFVTDCSGKPAANGWATYELEPYTGLEYGIKFHNPGLSSIESNYESRVESSAPEWEHSEAERFIYMPPGAEVLDYWTLEGDKHIYTSPIKPNKKVTIAVSATPPGMGFQTPYYAKVWINRARWPMYSRVEAEPENGTRMSFATFPDVVTSFLLGCQNCEESIERHTLVIPSHTRGTTTRYAVLTRPDVLVIPPPHDLFANPPFKIRRPGSYEEDSQLRFVLHAPTASRCQVIGEWTGWRDSPLEMRCTEDGAYWWAQVSVAEITGNQNADYHGVHYKYLLSEQREVQDPAAGWVETSSPDKASRLLQSDKFKWNDVDAVLPSWDRWVVYQLHPARFSKRFPGNEPLLRVAEEIENPDGYLRKLKINTLLLMPVNEVGSSNSWGYDPAFYYAVENDYGGPDALKALVNTCHRHGITVMLDVVFNHAGTVDNSLWSTARQTFFDGDTAWGAMLNFDQAQCRHFFEQNLVYLQREYHVDGFRLDHTYTIVHSSERQFYVREPGSGGGWEFLHALRHALNTQGTRSCLLMAEHLPNEWSLTNYGGPMDTQWDDDFHDRLEDACRGENVMGPLANAMQHSHTLCDNWYKPTNYSESHDEVGNTADRIASIAGFSRGLRMSKVAGACTLLARGIPMLFMGAESGEHRQFRFGANDALDLDEYIARDDLGHVRSWWNTLTELHDNDNIKGPAPLAVHYAQDHKLAFSRGLAGDIFIILNFGGWAGRINLAELNLPDNTYRERWNSTWPDFSVENEDEHTNGGWDARLHRWDFLNIPDYGAVVLERV